MNTQTNSIYDNSESPLSPILGPCAAKGSPGYSPFGCSFLMSIIHTNPESHQHSIIPKIQSSSIFPRFKLSILTGGTFWESHLLYPPRTFTGSTGGLSGSQRLRGFCSVYPTPAGSKPQGCPFCFILGTPSPIGISL